ncbi:MAG: transcriptional repressor [Thermodesulfovibrio sp.]|nr:transcriptional repressor [Thermodesulfovibrio sp.]
MKEYRSTKEDSLEEFVKKCKECGLKITPQRISIYKEVLNSENHPSAEIIYRRIKRIHPGISFDTVNRTLLTLSEMGLLEIVEGSGDVRRFDPNNKNHHHFRCKKCGKIVDFYNESYDKLEVPDYLKKKFIINKVRVLLEGICDNCINKTQD